MVKLMPDEEIFQGINERLDEIKKDLNENGITDNVLNLTTDLALMFAIAWIENHGYTEQEFMKDYILHVIERRLNEFFGFKEKTEGGFLNDIVRNEYRILRKWEVPKKMEVGDIDIKIIKNTKK